MLGAWAFESYTPAAFVVGQGFLAAFWLLFLGVSLLYALRQPAVADALVAADDRRLGRQPGAARVEGVVQQHLRLRRPARAGHRPAR